MRHKTDSKYAQWFKQQFGALPLPPSKLEQLVDRHEALTLELHKTKIALRRAHRLESLWKAARYAWNLKDKDKQ